ncbi:MAG: DUF6580 family putative transport protein [Roseibacillus sp.]
MSIGPRPVLFLVAILALISFRQIGMNYELHHFQPFTALFFALAALKSARWLLIPLAGYVLSTVWTEGSLSLWILSPLLAYGLIAVWGTRFSNRTSAPTLLGASLGGAGIFYLVTNSISWLASPVYAKSFGGMAQALWTGTPGFPPTWMFFRNDAVATLLFTAIVVVLNRMTFGKRTEEVAVTA